MKIIGRWVWRTVIYPKLLSYVKQTKTDLDDQALNKVARIIEDLLK